MRAIFKEQRLILVPETEAEASDLAIWKEAHASQHFVVRQTTGKGVMLLLDEGALTIAGPTQPRPPIPTPDTAPAIPGEPSEGPPTVPADNRVLFYKRDRAAFGFCSNFHPAPIVLDGENWPTTEHYYQFQKSFDRRYRQAIRSATTPGQAKRLAAPPDATGHTGSDSWFRKNGAMPRPDWNEAKLEIMRRAIRAKFTQNAELARMLLSTGTAELVEDSKSDSFWGAGADGSGENWLGRLLMELRDELRTSPLRNDVKEKS